MNKKTKYIISAGLCASISLVTLSIAISILSPVSSNPVNFNSSIKAAAQTFDSGQAPGVSVSFSLENKTSATANDPEKLEAEKWGLQPGESLGFYLNTTTYSYSSQKPTLLPGTEQTNVAEICSYKFDTAHEVHLKMQDTVTRYGVENKTYTVGGLYYNHGYNNNGGYEGPWNNATPVFGWSNGKQNYCSELYGFSCNDVMKHLPGGAFYKCPHLESVSIGKNVSSDGNTWGSGPTGGNPLTFGKCPNLKADKITVSPLNTTYIAIQSQVQNVDGIVVINEKTGGLLGGTLAAGGIVLSDIFKKKDGKFSIPFQKNFDSCDAIELIDLRADPEEYGKEDSDPGKNLEIKNKNEFFFKGAAFLNCANLRDVFVYRPDYNKDNWGVWSGGGSDSSTNNAGIFGALNSGGVGDGATITNEKIKLWLTPVLKRTDPYGNEYTIPSFEKDSAGKISDTQLQKYKNAAPRPYGTSSDGRFQIDAKNIERTAALKDVTLEGEDVVVFEPQEHGAFKQPYNVISHTESGATTENVNYYWKLETVPTGDTNCPFTAEDGYVSPETIQNSDDSKIRISSSKGTISLSKETPIPHQETSGVGALSLGQDDYYYGFKLTVAAAYDPSQKFAERYLKIYVKDSDLALYGQQEIKSLYGTKKSQYEYNVYYKENEIAGYNDTSFAISTQDKNEDEVFATGTPVQSLQLPGGYVKVNKDSKWKSFLQIDSSIQSGIHYFSIWVKAPFYNGSITVNRTSKLDITLNIVGPTIKISGLNSSYEFKNDKNEITIENVRAKVEIPEDEKTHFRDVLKKQLTLATETSNSNYPISIINVVGHKDKDNEDLYDYFEFTVKISNANIATVSPMNIKIKANVDSDSGINGSASFNVSISRSILTVSDFSGIATTLENQYKNPSNSTQSPNTDATFNIYLNNQLLTPTSLNGGTLSVGIQSFTDQYGNDWATGSSVLFLPTRIFYDSNHWTVPFAVSQLDTIFNTNLDINATLILKFTYTLGTSTIETYSSPITIKNYAYNIDLSFWTVKDQDKLISNDFSYVIDDDTSSAYKTEQQVYFEPVLKYSNSTDPVTGHNWYYKFDLGVYDSNTKAYVFNPTSGGSDPISLATDKTTPVLSGTTNFCKFIPSELNSNIKYNNGSPEIGNLKDFAYRVTCNYGDASDLVITKNFTVSLITLGDIDIKDPKSDVKIEKLTPIKYVKGANISGQDSVTYPDKTQTFSLKLKNQTDKQVKIDSAAFEFASSNTNLSSVISSLFQGSISAESVSVNDEKICQISLTSTGITSLANVLAGKYTINVNISINLEEVVTPPDSEKEEATVIKSIPFDFEIIDPSFNAKSPVSASTVKIDVLNEKTGYTYSFPILSELTPPTIYSSDLPVIDSYEWKTTGPNSIAVNPAPVTYFDNQKYEGKLCKFVHVIFKEKGDITLTVNVSPPASYFTSSEQVKQINYQKTVIVNFKVDTHYDQGWTFKDMPTSLQAYTFERAKLIDDIKLANAYGESETVNDINFTIEATNYDEVTKYSSAELNSWFPIKKVTTDGIVKAQLWISDNCPVIHQTIKIVGINEKTRASVTPHLIKLDVYNPKIFSSPKAEFTLPKNSGWKKETLSIENPNIKGVNADFQGSVLWSTDISLSDIILLIPHKDDQTKCDVSFNTNKISSSVFADIPVTAYVQSVSSSGIKKQAFTTMIHVNFVDTTMGVAMLTPAIVSFLALVAIVILALI